MRSAVMTHSSVESRVPARTPEMERFAEMIELTISGAQARDATLTQIWKGVEAAVTEAVTHQNTSALVVDKRHTTNDWRDSALCLKGTNYIIFTEEKCAPRQKKVCLNCPVKSECLIDALRVKELMGVFGGLRTAERGRIQKKLAEALSERIELETTRISDRVVGKTES